MTIKALVGAIIAFLLSLSSFLFFLFYVEPEYLSFSGFFFFYSSIFGMLWGGLMILGWLAERKEWLSENMQESFFRRTGLFSIFAVSNIILSQTGRWSWYVMIGILAVVFMTDYLMKKKK